MFREKSSRFTPQTIFGLAVAESGFGRVCPVCGERWSDKKQFIKDTEEARPELRRAGTCETVLIRIRRHHCGGEMSIGATW